MPGRWSGLRSSGALTYTDCTDSEPLIPTHGGYRKLKSFQVAQLCYDLTVRFCDRYIDRRSRTHDQMVQAARSGVQNIAEGSKASGTSRKMELKLTNVARASLEELRLDYEDFLRHRGLEQWAPEHPILKRFKARRCASVDDVKAWVEDERSKKRLPSSQLVANALLSLLNLACHFLDKQILAQASNFLEEGGFTERLHRIRTERRRRAQ